MRDPMPRKSTSARRRRSRSNRKPSATCSPRRRARARSSRASNGATRSSFDPRRQRGALPARAGCAIRSRARRAGRHRILEPTPVSRSPIPGRATPSIFVRGYEDDGKARAPIDVDWSASRGSMAPSSAMPGPAQLPEMVNALLEHGRVRTNRPRSSSTARLAQQESIVGTLGTSCRRSKPPTNGAPASCVVGRVVGLREHLRWFDCEAALRPADSRDAAARSGGRDGPSSSSRSAAKRSKRR